MYDLKSPEDVHVLNDGATENGPVPQHCGLEHMIFSNVLTTDVLLFCFCYPIKSTVGPT